MPSRGRSQKKRRAARPSAKSTARPIWTGSINFGLVNIPVGLYAAEANSAIDFDLLDKRDFARVRYHRVNEATGKEVPWGDIVKGYEYKRGEYVALTDDDFLKANVEATQSIDILDFVDAADISPMYFDKPYYLAPRKNGQRGYALLLEVMKRRGKAGIARVVIRSRQHLAALLAEGPWLILNLLRFSHELRDPAALALPATKSPPKSHQELRLAEQLVESMAAKWNPKKYRDEYRQDLLRMIEKKVRAGQTKAIEPAAPVRQPKSNGKVVDIMHLLRRSMEQVSKTTPSSGGRKAS